MGERDGTLVGRVAVVTGAGRGIGAAVARALAREGARVVVNDVGAALDGTGVDAGPADAVAAEIRAAGGEAVAHYGSVADHEDARRLVETAVTHFGGLDVLVNVAGILRDRMIMNLEPEDCRAVLAVHLDGTYNTTHFAARYWREHRGGRYRLINFTSSSGLFGAPGQPNYAAAKMGIVGFTYSCARALARYGVTANAVAPSADTRMIDSIPAERRRSVPGPDRSPEHVATLVAYLAGPRSGWLNGRVMGARGPEYTLYSNPEPVRVLRGREPWDVQDLGEELHQTFGPAVDGSPLFAPPPGEMDGGQ